MSSTRVRNLNKPIVYDYFKELEQSTKQLNLTESPGKVWNVDETNLSMKHCPLKKCSKKGVGSVPGLVSNSRESVTIVACINASGTSMPPMIIAKGKTEKSLNGFNRSEGPSSALWHYQSNAWIDEGGCLKWFNDIFLKHCGPARPRLLILDRHSSHESLELLETCMRENIRTLGLPAHNTHYLCPLDRTVFGPFKKRHNAVCDDFTTKSCRGWAVNISDQPAYDEDNPDINLWTYGISPLLSEFPRIYLFPIKAVRSKVEILVARIEWFVYSRDNPDCFDILFIISARLFFLMVDSCITGIIVWIYRTLP